MTTATATRAPRSRAAIVLSVLCLLFLAAAAVGWWKALAAQGALSSANTSLQTVVQERDAFAARVAALQTEAVTRSAQLGTATADAEQAKAELAQLRRQAGDTAALQARATAAEQAAALAAAREHSAESQTNALEDARPRRLQYDPALVPPRPQPAGTANITPPADGSVIAPALPVPGLPPGSTPRDFLVAAQQAIRAGRLGEAQSALERAEVRLLNGFRPGDQLPADTHPSVAAIERILDQLGGNQTDTALSGVDALLSRPGPGR